MSVDERCVFIKFNELGDNVAGKVTEEIFRLGGSNSVAFGNPAVAYIAYVPEDKVEELRGYQVDGRDVFELYSDRVEDSELAKLGNGWNGMVGIYNSMLANKSVLLGEREPTEAEIAELEMVRESMRAASHLNIRFD